MIVKTQAAVLRVIPFSETSRIVTWLTSDYGKISTVIKGSQRRNSRFLGQYDLFYTCELLFYLRIYQGLHIVKECSPLKFRSSLRTRWKATACASYFADAVSRICPVHAPHPELYHWLDSVFDFLCGQDPVDKCLFWFELKLMEVMGLSPQLSDCLKCKRPLSRLGEAGLSESRRSTGLAGEVPRHVFSYVQGGVYCPGCSDVRMPDTVEISPDILGLLRFWQSSPTWQSAERSKCTGRQTGAAETILGLLLQYHLGIPVSSRAIALDVLRRQAPARDALKAGFSPA